MLKYEDEDTVEYLMGIEKEMYKSYSRLTYIEWKDLHSEKVETEAKNIAAEKGWEFVTYPGNASLLESLMWGRWNDDDFLIVRPGYTVAASWDETIIKAVPVEDKNHEPH
jgi:hypothetical protein